MILIARFSRAILSRLHFLFAKLSVQWINITHVGVQVHRSAAVGSGLNLKVTDGGTFLVGAGTTIARSVEIVVSRGNLSIGEKVFIGPMCTLVVHNRVVIGDGSLIAERVTIRDQDHEIHGKGGVSIRMAGMRTAPVEIGANVWIGAGAVVLRGVTIGAGAVIGANAVVTKDVPENAIAVGIPARVISYRG